MDALELLLNRYSQGKLTEPAPSDAALNTILCAGLRAPDHAHLRPWRFLVYRGEGREELGCIFERAAKNNPDLNDAAVLKAPTLPLRAPIVITVIAQVVDHPKVPRVEQLLSAGCATMAMQQAAQALGFGGIWRSGVYTQDPYVNDALELGPEDEIVGFLYLGTEQFQGKPSEVPNLSDFVTFIGE
ncbi:NAD(P)H nitroreductase [Echinimonas agarilytica]|uniref:Putative NAD(P)H nitroreductase n=1 Tax=Echinimonas agarilytica TaxID=1215918 RepID=A0AA41W6R8_9GAMM|nr:NAD(P)H nitroreductase [Echinimonas agarilytica]MCM2679970.1 NAD(P)H nitroreductase [Echinimonas agarilytica]